MFFCAAEMESLKKVLHADSRVEREIEKKKNRARVRPKCSEHLDNVSKSLQACTVTALVCSHPSGVHVA